jgi:hypothetical protein
MKQSLTAKDAKHAKEGTSAKPHRKRHKGREGIQYPLKKKP